MTDAKPAPPLTVYFDGGCPVCAGEIAFYRRRPGTPSVAWVDISTAPAAALGPDLSRDQALARMHVRCADGSLRSGAAAFAALWRLMPGFTWLGRALAIPPVGLAAELAYRLFLLIRRTWR
jgi:predicted DCC family thiol-disulfide oxidoreductase YuxK